MSDKEKRIEPLEEDTLLQEELLEEQQAEETRESEEEYSLNDDRRVKTLSPTTLVVKRFLRNRVADTGLIIIAIMFLFSFVGGALTPYAEDQLFYRYDETNDQYAAVTENKSFRYEAAEAGSFPSLAQAKFVLAQKNGDETFEAADTTYTLKEEGDSFYGIYVGDQLVAYAALDVVSASTADTELSFALKYAILKAYTNQTAVDAENVSAEDAETTTAVATFEVDGAEYQLLPDGTVTTGGDEVAYAGRYIVNVLASDRFLTRQFKDELIAAIQSGADEFTFTNENDEKATYSLDYDAGTETWSVLESVKTHVFDTYASPSSKHWLGTDKNGMDMLTRLMYGGRVSLYIGFIVVFIETALGILFGGISGYFGGWVDNLIMRIVDIFYCIPSMPLIIILGAAMDAMRVDPQIRMIYLMLILGFLGWPGIARMVRGQILSLREQEFMTATEALGIRVSRRIFKHLIPNVIPQLIVIMTMGLGDTILTEATLSFLGLGVKFPFASWGNIINDVNNTYVLTNYWFIWIPAGVCLLLTVLAFNLVGDGLRDAFDPKMKR